ncbi:MAG: hypothetical protein AAGB93_04740 [Planctomycetota bacterium]
MPIPALAFRLALLAASFLAPFPAPAGAAPAQSGPGLPSWSYRIVGQASGYVVFIADKETDGVFELFRAELDGSGTTKLSPPLAPGGRVREAWIAPDGQSVAFRADVSVPFVDEFWVAAADGSGATRVSPPLVPNGAFLFLQSEPWSPDSQWLAFGARATTPGVMDLYAVRPDGTQLRNLSSIQNPFGDVSFGWAWSPDSSRVAFIADAVVDNTHQLYSSPPTGPTVLVDGPSPSELDRDVRSFLWSPDGQRIAYTATFPFPGGTWLRTASPTGQGMIDIASDLPSGGAAAPAGAPDGSRIAWIGQHATPGVLEAFTALPNGGARVRVSGSMVNGGDVRAIRWAPTSDRILYRADQETNNREELYVSPAATGGGSVKINGPLSSNGAIDLSEWYWSPDGAYVAYAARQNTRPELWVSAADGSTNVAVNGPLPSWGRATLFGDPWAPDGSRLAYAGVQLSFNVQEIFTVRPDGSDLQRVSPAPPASGRSASVGPLWTGDSARVVLRGNFVEPTRRELFAARADGSAAPAICGAFVPGGSVDETYWVR